MQALAGAEAGHGGEEVVELTAADAGDAQEVVFAPFAVAQHAALGQLSGVVPGQGRGGGGRGQQGGEAEGGEDAGFHVGWLRGS